MRHVDSHDSTLHRNKRPFQPEITSYFYQNFNNYHHHQDQQGHSHSSSQDIDNNHQLHLDHFQNPDRRGRGPITRTHHLNQQHQYNNTTTTTSTSTSSTTTDRHDSPASSSSHSSFPPPPHPVQVNLLSVGMRVRKSVPEGYKTTTTKTLPSIQTTLSRPRPDAIKLPRESLDTALQHQRELLPFCGLQKIGGYAEQPVTNIHLYGGNDSNGNKPVNLFPLPAETFSQPFSSHSSTSTSSSPDSFPMNLNPQKRSWHDEDEVRVNLNDGFLFKMQMRGADDEVPVSPLSETPLAKGIMRPFAQPKTRRAGAAPRTLDSEPGATLRKDTDMDMEVENAGAQGREDFEDAEFLQWGQREVHMGGL